MNSHQIVDLLVLGVLLYCAIKGASRGLLSQLAWVVALLLCFKFSGTLAPAIEPMIAVAPPLKQWIAMLLVYVGLCGLSFVAAGMLSSWMQKAKVIDFDKHLGGVLGFVKGVVICMTGMFFAITMSEPMRQIVSKTYSGYAAAVILNNSQYLIPILPEHAVPTVQRVIDEFNRRLQPGFDDLNGAKPADPNEFGIASGGSDSGEGEFDLLDLFPTRNAGSVNSGQGNSQAPTPSLQDLLNQVPTEFRRDLTQQMMDRLRQSSPEEKRWLLQKLSGSIPENIGAVLDEFLRDPSNVGGQGTGSSSPPAELGRTETTLLNEIAAIYGGIYSREAFTANAMRFLEGVPGSIQRRVLEDWHADAIGLNSDPDPYTSIDTRLEERILRQLAKAGISLDRLDRNLRTKLSNVTNTYDHK